MTVLPEFIPPSPGAWELEQIHLTRPVSVFMADVFPSPMIRGFADGTKAYGVLLDYLDVAVINRFVYMAPRPVGAPKSAKGAPPRLVFEILRRIHPQIRRRIKRAEIVIRDRHWRHEVQWWHNEVKPSMAATAHALLKDDVSTLSISALVDHIHRATAFMAETTYWHHRFDICAMLPVGDFVSHVMDWTGLPVGEILHVVRGLSPVSAGAVDELAALRRAIQGEVLVAAATSSTFNVVLPLIGALVTERGGALSHAAIVAREYGLPGVVGCPGAVAAIKTGMRVRVDGATGEVWTAV